MPLPGHRLDLILVAHGAGGPARATAAWQALREGGVVRPDGSAGDRAGSVVDGGFARARLDVRDEDRLWSNQAGGFRATCPACGANVVPDLAPAIRERRPVRCGCGVASAIDAVHYAPPAAWGRAAIVLSDVGASELSAEGTAWADRRLAPWSRVWRRP